MHTYIYSFSYFSFFLISKTLSLVASSRFWALLFPSVKWDSQGTCLAVLLGAGSQYGASLGSELSKSCSPAFFCNEARSDKWHIISFGLSSQLKNLAAHYITLWLLLEKPQWQRLHTSFSLPGISLLSTCQSPFPPLKQVQIPFLREAFLANPTDGYYFISSSTQVYLSLWKFELTYMCLGKLFSLSILFRKERIS